MLNRFIAAAQSGDFNAIKSMFAPAALMTSDGGGKAVAVIRPLHGAERIARLAIPPAYEDVLYATDARAHLQAVGRDAAGRLQYRYHPDWTKVRETRKARQLQRRGIAGRVVGERPGRASE